MISVSLFRVEESFISAADLIEKFPHTLSDESAGVFKSEMACINQVEFCVREISFMLR